jgi:NADPH:quinone reductase-like Zn-dependent oxidoreductase
MLVIIRLNYWNRLKLYYFGLSPIKKPLIALQIALKTASASLEDRRERSSNPSWRANWKQARVIGAAMSSSPISGTVSVINTKTEDLRERVMELTAGKGVDAVFDTGGGPMFEPALRSLRSMRLKLTRGSPTLEIATCRPPNHNFSRLLGVDSFGLTSQKGAEIEHELDLGFEKGTLKPPPVELVPFEKAMDAYSRVAAGQAKTKQVLSFE